MGKIYKALEKSKKEQQKTKRTDAAVDTSQNKKIVPKKFADEAAKKQASKKQQGLKLKHTYSSLGDDSPYRHGSHDERNKRSTISEKNRYEIKENITDNLENFNKKQEQKNHIDQENNPSLGQKILTLKEDASFGQLDRINYQVKTSPKKGRPVKGAKNRGKIFKNENLPHTLVTLLKPRSYEAEQFKIIRTKLLFPEHGDPPNTILITSSQPGDGKTFVATNLAVSLAQNINSHVLLVDADIRKPDVHKRFRFADDIKGLSDYLADDQPIPNLLVRTTIHNLTVLPGGRAKRNPAELISSEKMRGLVTELSSRYNDRFIVIDAPPPAIAAETCALARFVDSLLIVVRSGQSSLKDMEEAILLLGKDKVRGIIFNDYDARESKYYGKKKYSNYYVN